MSIYYVPGIIGTRTTTTKIKKKTYPHEVHILVKRHSQ